MRVYSVHDEEILRDRELVREWAASGFLNSAQKTALFEDLRTDLRLTNGILRTVLFFFAALIVIAGVGMFAVGLSLHDESEFATVSIVSALICGTLADLACRNRFYRYGAEEALGISAVVLFSFGIVLYLGTPGSASADIAGLLVGILGGTALYLRFGFAYAAIGSLVCAAAIPFQLSVRPDEKRLLSALICAAALVLVRRLRLSRRDFPAGSAEEAVEAAAWFGTYVVLNVPLAASLFGLGPGLFFSFSQTASTGSRTWFYYFSWALMWILPAAGLWLGLRRKDRWVIVANLAAALLTLTTNKRYLGWPIHSWDPMLFGILLMSAAILIRRWLQHGPNAVRYGFTAARILRNDERVMAAVSIASAMVHPPVSLGPADSNAGRLHEGGGQSGGGGASGNF